MAENIQVLCFWAPLGAQGHNDFRSAGCLPFYKTSDAATAIQALSEIFILYKDRLQFHLGAIEDNLCIV